MSTVTIEAADDDHPTVVPTPSHAPTVVPVDVGGVTVHGELTGRSAPDQHPIGAVTGLQSALDGKADRGSQGPSHESILASGNVTLPTEHPVLTVRASAPAVLTVPDAPEGTVITVHVAEGWENIAWAPAIVVTGQTTTTETWVVLVRAEDTWRALVSGEPTLPTQYDSGVVDIAHLTNDTDWLASWGIVEVRRLGGIVELSVQIYSRDAWQFGLNSTVFRIPEGFRPSIDQTAIVLGPDPLPRYNVSSSNGYFRIERSSLLTLTHGMFMGATLTYLTNDPEPAP